MIFLINATAFAQSIERKPVKISEVKSRLNNAEGWVLTENGQWVNEQNQILHPASCNSYNSKCEISLGKDNFIYYELREITLGDKSYALLIKKYTKGNYKYPKLKEDWEAYNAYDFWVFEKEKLNEVLPQNITYNSAYEVNIKPVYSQTNFDLNEKDVNTAHIIAAICKSDAKANQYLKIKVFPVEVSGKKQIRFIYDTDIISPVNENFDPAEFDKYYFEVDYNTFKNFIQYN